MNTNDFLFRSSHQSQRIRLPQITLPGKRKLLKVLLRLYLIHIDALQLMLVKAFLGCQFLELFLNEKELGFFHLHLVNPPFILSWGRLMRPASGPSYSYP